MNYQQKKFIKKVKKAYHDYWWLQWYQCKKIVKGYKLEDVERNRKR